MSPKQFSDLAARLLCCPAAPCHEDGVRAAVEGLCTEHGLDFSRDAFGNVIVRLRTDARRRPLVFAAHLDHPGFEIVRPLGAGRWHARFLGGVPDRYFRPGLAVRLFPGDIAGQLGPRLPGEKQFELRAAPIARPAGVSSRLDSEARFAVWDLTDFSLRAGRIHARSCDDLIGVASILATLIELKRRRARVHVIGVISRAEEIGFLGALSVAASKQLPANSLVISLETSKEIPPVKMGRGMILRVGDRTSIFDSTATRYLSEVADALASAGEHFQYQRALMSGGTCEATAYQEFGFQTAAVCIALGNYHNCGARDRIAAEYVDVHDALGMTHLLIEAARRMNEFDKLVRRLPTRLQSYLKEARVKLRAR